MILKKNFRSVAQSLLLLSVVGCGGSSGTPPLGQVTGAVTINGEPLKDALVQFEPTTGRGSSAITNAAGKYDLVYVDQTRGALVGEHTVRITTYVEEDSPAAAKFKESIPKKYNSNSELKKTVKPGRNEFNFDLD
ncbi:hypothetical protein [Schlesneria paludicola]|uniref:hypothetical protein n=1 Tax=Schlesneria paludicola TaxID=360056 RepID=UPI0006800C56|nr:hypothetical protein [Schlesneria paludicola]